MKINVKILQGAECNVDVVGGDSVDRLKELVQVHYLIHFVLAFKGRTPIKTYLITARSNNFTGLHPKTCFFN